MIYLDVDDSGYLRSVFTRQVSEDEPELNLPHIDSLDGYDFSGNRIFAYRWDGKKLVLDDDKLAELMREEADEQNQWIIADLTEQLRQSDSIVLEALEGLFSATTATGFITSLIAAARNIRSVLAERSDLRQRIQALRGDK